VKPNTILKSTIANKQAIWLSDLNKYLLLNPPADEIVLKIYEGESDHSILNYCVDNLKYSQQEADLILYQIKNNLECLKKDKSEERVKPESLLKNSPENFDCKRTYKINEEVFLIEYESTNLEYLVHPKFAHLEISNEHAFSNHFQLFQENAKIKLIVNGAIKGCWKKDAEHFMTGKVLMEILQQITHSQEKDWMAVFHAAGISNGKQGLLFLGDSGNGKSTLSALLMASGFEVLADDFLPVESKTSYLSSFPSAISVKKQAIDLLAAGFPELKHAKEYTYPLFNKTVRYLSNPNSSKGVPKKVPCKALVFVKYEVNSGIQFTALAKDIAFQKLVPDSWISPLEANAKRFLDWFNRLPCYQLTYSNNKAMVKTITKLFDE